MSDLIVYELPKLNNPILISAFSGTFDASFASTETLSQLATSTLASDIAMIDPENIFNFSKTRPSVKIDASGSRIIDWPGVDIKVATFSEMDLIFVLGDEPHYKWNSVSQEIAALAKDLGCEYSISLGSVHGMVPHTREFPVYGYTSDSDLAYQFDLDQPSYQGPTGYLASLNTALEEIGIPSISLRVELPHYLPSPPSPKGVQSLLVSLEEMLDIKTQYEKLDNLTDDWEALVDEAVALDESNLTYIHQLEEQYDSEEEIFEASQDLVVELETFLLDNRKDIEIIESDEDDLDDS